jgi:hypothetical protein
MRNGEFYYYALLFVLAVAIPFFYGIRAACATSITEEQSRNAVVNWIALSGEQLEGELSGDILDTSDVLASDGTVVARIHNIVGGGYVVTAVDDAMEPVLCFSNTGYLKATSGNPLLDILIYDMGKRLSQYYDSTKKNTLAAPSAASSGSTFTLNKTRWLNLLSSGSKNKRMQTNSIADMRVAPLLKTQWGQGTDQLDLPLFNYATPNHYPTGCVATALSQVMYYFNWPQSNVVQNTYSIVIDNVATSATIQGGDGSGGAYDWDAMDAEPGVLTSPASRKMMGNLINDAATAIGSNFAAAGTGVPSLSTVLDVLKGQFQYADARFMSNSQNGIAYYRLFNAINSNLDANKPVILTIMGSSGRHAVVCDGYGYYYFTRYHHINMGYAGNGDAWYTLPLVSNSNGNYSMVEECVYNINWFAKANYVSGRVVDSDGEGIQGVMIQGKHLDTGGVIGVSVTNEKGIYAMALPVQYTGCLVTTSAQGRSFATYRRFLDTDYPDLSDVSFVDQGAARVVTPPAGLQFADTDEFSRGFFSVGENGTFFCSLCQTDKDFSCSPYLYNYKTEAFTELPIMLRDIHPDADHDEKLYAKFADITSNGHYCFTVYDPDSGYVIVTKISGKYSIISYGSRIKTIALKMNNKDQILGYYENELDGSTGYFVYDNETFTEVSIPCYPEDGTDRALASFNDNGVYLGSYWRNSYGHVNFFYDSKNDSCKIIEKRIGEQDYDYINFLDINNNNVVSGLDTVNESGILFMNNDFTIIGPSLTNTHRSCSVSGKNISVVSGHDTAYIYNYKPSAPSLSGVFSMLLSFGF